MHVYVFMLNVASKPIDRSRSNMIIGVLLQKSSAVVLVFHLALKLRVVHLRQILKL